MKRLLVNLSVLTAAGLGAAGLASCDSALTYAARVNGAVITRTQVDQDLADISRNKTYVAAIDKSSSGPLEGQTRGSYNKAFVARVLFLQIRSSLIHGVLVSHRALPSVKNVATAHDEVVQAFTQATFNAFPLRYQNELVNQRAEVDVFINSAPGGDISDAVVNRYYQAHLIDYTTETCARHIQITDLGTGGQIDYTASLADATKVAAQLAGGADFAALAKADSKDNQGTNGGSAGNGGVLGGSASDGCLSTQDLQQIATQVAPLAQVLTSLSVNQVSDPVKTQFGYHLVQVTSRKIASLDQATVRADVLQHLAVDRITQMMKTAAVNINPEFGTYDPKLDSTGAIVGVVPPPAPPGAAPLTTATTVAGG